MTNTILEISDRLKKYLEVDFEVSAESISANPKDDSGFHVSLTDNGNGTFTVAFDLWHEEFDNVNDAFNCFVFGLTKNCRLKLTKKGNKPIKWTVESNDNGTWEEYSTMGFFNFSFWKKPEFEFLQNNLIKNLNK